MASISWIVVRVERARSEVALHVVVALRQHDRHAPGEEAADLVDGIAAAASLRTGRG